MKIAAINLVAVATGGALGASLRYILVVVAHSITGKDFPSGTIFVNVLGSFLIGYLILVLPETDNPSSFLRLLVITGLLGGFTTYSAFSMETLQLIQEGHLNKAGLNVALTLVLCFVAVWAGYLAGRGIHQ
jgi:CrcB protein